MKRFLAVLSSAYLCAAVASPAWAQIPGSQAPGALPPSATMPKEIPILVPAQTGQQPGAPIILRAVDGKRGQATGAGSILGPATQSTGKPASAVPLPPIIEARSLGNSPLFPSPNAAAPANSKVNADSSSQAMGPSPTTAFGMQMKAQHPDISLPTEFPIVKVEAGSSPLGRALPQLPEAPAKSEAELPQSEPVVIAGAGKSSAARVKEVKIPLVSPAGLGNSGSSVEQSSSMPSGLSQETLPQERQLPAIVRTEMALPPIKKGEEFPRTPKEVPVIGADAAKSQVLSKSGVSAKQVSAPSESEFDFVPALVANPAALKQDAIVQPAAPLLEQDLGTPIGGHSHEHAEHLHGASDSGIIDAFVDGGALVGNSYLDSHDHGSCEHCGGTGCSHCGLGGWNALGNRGGIALGGGCENGCFGLLPCAQNYFIADALYWTRNGGNVIGTDFGGLYDYDWNFGGQVTMGTRTDPLYGHELSYFGLFELDAGNTDVSPTGDIDALFVPGGSLGYGDTSAFFDATEVTQTANSRLHSFQVNRVRLGWDVVQSHLGLRYIWFEDEYQMQSRNLFGDTGRLSLNASNNLIGPEVGVKLFYDVGRRISFSTHWKVGGYLNAYRTETFLQNNGLTKVNNSDSGTGFSATFDIGANAHIHITQRMRLRGGYGLLWLWDVASVTDNFPSSLTTASGTSTNDSADAIFHGANVGLEYYW